MGKSSPRPVVCRGCATEFITCWGKQIFCTKKCRRDFFNAPAYKATVDRGTCTVSGCTTAVLAKEMCNMHYVRLTVYGSTDDPRIARRNRRFWARVEKTDNCWNWTGTIDRLGYGAGLVIDGKTIRPHRYAYQQLVGELPKELDHRCHNRRCVNPEHLRPATRSQNLENLSGARSDSGTGIRGVSFHKLTGKYLAQVCKNGKQHYCGAFEKIEDAEAAAIAKRLELYTFNELDRESA